MVAAATRSALLHKRLHGEILSGRYPPGTKLPFAELVASYDCSIGSLREVLQRLVEVGLVESVAQQGFRVIPVTVEDLQDLTVARSEIEVAAFRHAILNGDVAWEGSVVSALHVLERTPSVDEVATDRLTGAWSIAHGEFHQTLLNGCANRRLRAAATSLRDVAELYRRWSIPYKPHKGRDTASEHRAIVEAALQRDAEGAADLLRRHIELTTYNLVPVLEAAFREGEPATV